MENAEMFMQSQKIRSVGVTGIEHAQFVSNATISHMVDRARKKISDIELSNTADESDEATEEWLKLSKQFEVNIDFDAIRDDLLNKADQVNEGFEKFTKKFKDIDVEAIREEISNRFDNTTEGFEKLRKKFKGKLAGDAILNDLLNKGAEAIGGEQGKTGDDSNSGGNFKFDLPKFDLAMKQVAKVASNCIKAIERG